MSEPRPTIGIDGPGRNRDLGTGPDLPPRRLLLTRPDVAGAMGSLEPLLEDTLTAPLGQVNRLGLYRIESSPFDK